MVKAPLEGLSPVSVNVRLLPGVWRRPHLLSFSDQGVYSRYQLQEQTVSVCPLTFPYCLSSDSWPISRQNSMHSSCSPSQGRQPTLAAFLHCPSYTALPTLPFLRTLHCCTPVMWAIPLCLHDPSKVIVRWLHADFWFWFPMMHTSVYKHCRGMLSTPGVPIAQKKFERFPHKTVVQAFRSLLIVHCWFRQV